jgi:hypothetical protein
MRLAVHRKIGVEKTALAIRYNILSGALFDITSLYRAGAINIQDIPAASVKRSSC